MLWWRVFGVVQNGEDTPWKHALVVRGEDEHSAPKHCGVDIRLSIHTSVETIRKPNAGFWPIGSVDFHD